MVLSSINSPIEPFLSSTCSLWPFSLGGHQGWRRNVLAIQKRDKEGRNSCLNGRSDGGTGSILECQILNQWKHKYLLYWSLHHRSTFVKKKHSASLERSHSLSFFPAYSALKITPTLHVGSSCLSLDSFLFNTNVGRLRQGAFKYSKHNMQ